MVSILSNPIQFLRMDWAPSDRSPGWLYQQDALRNGAILLLRKWRHSKSGHCLGKNRAVLTITIVKATHLHVEFNERVTSPQSLMNVFVSLCL